VSASGGLRTLDPLQTHSSLPPCYKILAAPLCCLSAYVLVTTVSRVKMTEPVEMPFGGILAWANGAMGARLPQREKALYGRHVLDTPWSNVRVQ